MGKFIVMEGLDGTGKTTQTKLLAEYIRKSGERVFVTAEPTSFETGKLIRRMLSGEITLSPWETAALFFADRVAHNTDGENGLEKHIQNGETVISDRYYYSTFAYQGYETDLKWVIDMHYGCPELRKPDLAFFLTMSAEQCVERITANRPYEKIEIYENVERLMKINKQFDTVFSLLKDKENIVYIDADGSVEEVFERIRRAFDAFGEKNV